MRAVLASADRLWDNGQVITVAFIQPYPGTLVQQGKVKTVVQEWAKYTNLTFNFINEPEAMLRITFQPGQGSWSYVAQDNLSIQPSTRPTMNYSAVSTGRAILNTDRRVILHEFGHAIGFLHEHQSSRRGDKITIKVEAAIEYYTQSPGWTRELVIQQIIDVYNDSEVSNFSTIDLNSIMIYPMPAALNVEGIEIVYNTVLSNFDKAYGVINYPYLPGQPAPLADPQWTFEHALDVAGVQGESREKILYEYAQGDTEGIRAEFGLWSLNQRALALEAKLKEKK